MLPEPLTTPDMDVRDLDGFMLNVERLLASELWALTKNQPHLFRGALALWARAWKQIPAGSLCGDSRILASYAEVTLSCFRKHESVLMHGFIMCSDGRYYHRHLSGEVRKIWPSVQRARAKRNADNERLKRWREQQRNGEETRFETPGETAKKRVPNCLDSDRYRDSDIKKDSTSLRSVEGAHPKTEVVTKRVSNGTRWPPDAVVPDDWIGDAEAKRDEHAMAAIDLRLEAERFANYWAGLSGAKATKVDWRKTWLNWATDQSRTQANGQGRGSSAKGASSHDSHLMGLALLREEIRSRSGRGSGEG